MSEITQLDLFEFKPDNEGFEKWAQEFQWTYKSSLHGRQVTRPLNRLNTSHLMNIIRMLYNHLTIPFPKLRPIRFTNVYRGFKELAETETAVVVEDVVFGLIEIEKRILNPQPRHGLLAAQQHNDLEFIKQELLALTKGEKDAQEQRPETDGD